MLTRVAQVSTEPVELPHQQGVVGAEGFQAAGQLGAVVLLAGGLVLIQRLRVDASDAGIALRSVVRDPSAFETRM